MNVLNITRSARKPGHGMGGRYGLSGVSDTLCMKQTILKQAKKYVIEPLNVQASQFEQFTAKVEYCIVGSFPQPNVS